MDIFTADSDVFLEDQSCRMQDCPASWRIFHLDCIGLDKKKKKRHEMYPACSNCRKTSPWSQKEIGIKKISLREISEFKGLTVPPNTIRMWWTLVCSSIHLCEPKLEIETLQQLPAHISSLDFINIFPELGLFCSCTVFKSVQALFESRKTLLMEASRVT